MEKVRTKDEVIANLLAQRSEFELLVLQGQASAQISVEFIDRVLLMLAPDTNSHERIT